MTNEPLGTAARSLREAEEAADDESVADRLDRQAEQFGRMAEDDSGVDHGRLARHEHVLSEISDDQGEGDVADHVGEALAAITSYRETLEGV